MSEQPYLDKIVVEKIWNPAYDQDAECHCGHPYHRHFDSYDRMSNVGCKYCDCHEFVCATVWQGERQ